MRTCTYHGPEGTEFCDEPATFYFRWPWGAEGKVCTHHMPYLRSLAQQLGHEQGLLIAPLEQLAPLEPAPLEQLAPLEPAPLEQLAPLEPAPLEQQPVGEPLEHFIVGEPALEQPEEAEAPTTVPDGLRPADTDVSAE